MTPKPLVSVCIPCYNAEAYVGAAVESVLSQSWPHLEVIVVDDGSTDGSWEVLSRYASAQVHVLQQENGGQCAAANRAWCVAQGDLIKFFDADDLLAPQSIEHQVQRLEGRSDAVASAQWGRFYDDDLSTFRLNPEPVWRDMSATDWLVEAWANAQPMMQCALWLIPRPLLQRAGGWDESLSLINDFEFFARVLCHSSEVLFTPEATLYYRSGLIGSLSGQKSQRAIESAFHSILKGTDYLLASRSDALAKRSCANIMQNFIYTFYPDCADLRAEMSAKIKDLGGSTLRPAGGPWFQRAARLLGWKGARKLQRITGRY
jgi:glycosyltransferase involved in cell wall biosynthesis